MIHPSDIIRIKNCPASAIYAKSLYKKSIDIEENIDAAITYLKMNRNDYDCRYFSELQRNILDAMIYTQNTLIEKGCVNISFINVKKIGKFDFNGIAIAATHGDNKVVYIANIAQEEIIGGKKDKMLYLEYWGALAHKYYKADICLINLFNFELNKWLFTRSLAINKNNIQKIIEKIRLIERDAVVSFKMKHGGHCIDCSIAEYCPETNSQCFDESEYEIYEKIKELIKCENIDKRAFIMKYLYEKMLENKSQIKKKVTIYKTIGRVLSAHGYI